MRYFYAWTPLVAVTTVVLLSLPWLALIALMVFALVALPALALAIVVAPYMLIHAISSRWHNRNPALQPSPGAAPAAHQHTFESGYAS